MKLKDIYIAHTNCITPIGFTVATNIDNISNGVSGLALQDNRQLSASPFYAGIINTKEIEAAFSKMNNGKSYTRLEKLMILALQPVIAASGIAFSDRVGLIVSTTKGNITAVKGKEIPVEAYLHTLAKTVAAYFDFKTEPIVVSNACVSGIQAISVAKRLIEGDMFDNVFVVSGDEVSEFVLAGFKSFQAMSDMPCRPFAPDRDGITLGEAAAAALITTNAEHAKARIAGDGSINDANHISGPSRTGEGLVKSIESALSEAGVSTQKIDYISAHGTATLYNDEMETVAFNRMGLNKVPINSFKGYYGHTLGSSGLLETVIGLESLLQNRLFKSIGYEDDGTAQQISVITENCKKEIHYFLKTASGFGGTNTAVLFEKIIK
jgi:3-oxoacyl-[acyl-carrier-protein] synthase-1